MEKLSVEDLSDDVIRKITNNIAFINRWVDKADRDKLLFVKGEMPVLVTAEHALNHIRNNFIKVYEINVDMLSLGISKESNCNCLLPLSVIQDPNYFNNSFFLREALDVIKDNDVRLVLSLHGMIDKEDRKDICLGNLNGVSLKDSFGKNFYENLRNNLSLHYSVSENDPFPGGKFLSDIGINAVQIEVKKSLRVDRYKLMKLIKVISGSLGTIE